MSHNRESHTSFFESIASRLKCRIARCGVPACECEDCIQEAWLALQERHSDWALDEPRNLLWLAAVARNKARDFHRYRKRHQIQPLDDMAPFSVIKSVQAPPDPDQDGRVQEVISKLRENLKRLGEVNREILMTRVLLGLTYREIALAVNLEAGQVKKRYYRTLYRLQKELHPSVRGCNNG